jgi:hypothetical protein
LDACPYNLLCVYVISDSKHPVCVPYTTAKPRVGVVAVWVVRVGGPESVPIDVLCMTNTALASC